MIEYRQRPRCDASYARALDAGLSPLAANVLARRVRGFDGDLLPLVRPALRHLSDPGRLPDAEVAVARLARAIENAEVIALVTDYDVDGITAHAVMLQSLTEHFSHPIEKVRSVIGHRLEDGYGLSDNVCARLLAARPPPAVVVTADCGTSDAERIARLAAHGVDVIVTDHHAVPDEGAPAAALATVNPSRADACYPDPAIAGCMVAWLLMARLRSALIERGRLPSDAPKLGSSLDLVALGTVADAVSLFSPSNRAVVRAGLDVLNRRTRPCWQALDVLLERNGGRYTTEDLGFQIGPRINARGRLADPFAALRFLRAETLAEAQHFLGVLDRDNRDRREMEKAMLTTARQQADRRLGAHDQVLCVYADDFHPGVQGIVASRLVEAYGRVTAVLSPARDAGTVSGSLRSIDDVDVAAALRAVAREHSGLLHKFGGHPKAAGVTLGRSDVGAFRDALAGAVRKQLGDARPGPVILHDGPLPATQFTVQALRELAELAPYGRGFEPPTFCGEFRVQAVRPVGADPVHLSLQFAAGNARCRGIWFRALPEAGARMPIAVGDAVTCAFRLAPDEWRGGEAVQMIVAHARRCNAVRD